MRAKRERGDWESYARDRARILSSIFMEVATQKAMEIINIETKGQGKRRLC
jgi:hypothetical protein